MFLQYVRKTQRSCSIAEFLYLQNVKNYLVGRQENRKKHWELQLSYAFYEIWNSYEEDTNISLQWGPSRVRGGLVSTGQGSDHVTDYLYALFSKHWIKYNLME